MENGKLSVQRRREDLKNKLKGSLINFKLTPGQGQSKEIVIGDRTPVPTLIKNDFDEMYTLGKKLGEGASGAVYNCTSKKDGKIYAVKISRGDVELLRTSKRTFKIMKGLNHPNIIKAKCLFLNQVNQKMHFLMEYCPYPSLDAIQNRLNFQQKKQIITELLNTLQYLHNQGVCHRDIKPENILYDQKENKLKLIDFGISKKVCGNRDQVIEMWTSTGTLRYMAPQMLSGGSYDLKVDMWALGVLIYKLFYSKFPFQSQYQSDLIQKISHQQPQYDDSNTLLNDFIKHLLHKDPKTRLTATDCLRHPWIQNTILKTKQRLGSGDDFDILLHIRNRNYSVGIIGTPEMKISKQDKIQELKQLIIFQQKRIYQNLPLYIREN